MSKAQELKSLAEEFAWKSMPISDAPVARDKLHAAIDALFSPDVGACPVCGSDCNERDELAKAEREIERLLDELHEEMYGVTGDDS